MMDIYETWADALPSPCATAQRLKAGAHLPKVGVRTLPSRCKCRSQAATIVLHRTSRTRPKSRASSPVAPSSRACSTRANARLLARHPAARRGRRPPPGRRACACAPSHVPGWHRGQRSLPLCSDNGAQNLHNRRALGRNDGTPAPFACPPHAHTPDGVRACFASARCRRLPRPAAPIVPYCVPIVFPQRCTKPAQSASSRQERLQGWVASCWRNLACYAGPGASLHGRCALEQLDRVSSNAAAQFRARRVASRRETRRSG